ncbi:MAG: hypothetical protein ACJKTH_02845 [Patescibacteria group bacterium UBA2163]
MRMQETFGDSFALSADFYAERAEDIVQIAGLAGFGALVLLALWQGGKAVENGAKRIHQAKREQVSVT